LPMPVALQEKWGHLMVDDPPEVRSRIVGGSPVPSGGRAYQIALLRSGSFTCGGTLISPRTVLSAAHCVTGSNTFTIVYDTLNYAAGGQTLAVSTVISHPQYNANTIDNDVAVLILANAFTPGTNAAISTLAAAGTDPAAGTPLVVSGWGRTSAGGPLSAVLLQANLDVVGRDACSGLWGGTNPITARMVCAHSTNQSACNGDSGGPLTASGTQVGVVSWGSSQCLHQTLPNVYAAVGELRPWIDQNTIS